MSVIPASPLVIPAKAGTQCSRSPRRILPRPLDAGLRRYDDWISSSRRRPGPSAPGFRPPDSDPWSPRRILPRPLDTGLRRYDEGSVFPAQAGIQWLGLRRDDEFGLDTGLRRYDEYTAAGVCKELCVHVTQRYRPDRGREAGVAIAPAWHRHRTAPRQGRPGACAAVGSAALERPARRRQRCPA